MILENGFLLNDRYRILDILGLGEMGVVYRAVDEKLDISVAIKEGRFLSEEDALQFEHGARLLASLRHPNLTRVFDYFVIDGEGQYLVMEYIEGENLYQWAAHNEGITEMEALQIGIVICNALTYLHSQDPPISHLGIKPENIRFTPLGEIILVDLGLVKINQAKKATTITVRAPSGSFTPPELFGEGSPDPRSDIFSLGATLYAVLAGFPPEDSLDRVTGKSQLSPLRNYMPHLSRQTALAIEKALSLRFEDRWQSAAEMRDALIKARDALPVEKQLNTRLASLLQATPDAEKPLPSTPKAGKIAGFFQDGRVREFLARDPVWFFYGAVIILLVALFGFTLSRPQGLRGIFLDGLATTQVQEIEEEPGWVTELQAIPCETDSRQNPSSETANEPGESNTLNPEPIPSPTPTGGGAGLIAYASDRSGLPQIWLVDVATKQTTQLTNLDDGACQPDWSPTGKQIVFTSPCTGKRTTHLGSRLLIIDVESGALTPLPASLEGDFDPAWSPDGEWIAYTTLIGGRAQLAKINLNDLTSIRLSDGSYLDSSPAWSPDGKRLAFVRYRGVAQIWLMDADGENPVQFTLSGAIDNSNPDWFPDGSMILFSQSLGLGSPSKQLFGMRLEDLGQAEEYVILPRMRLDYIPLMDNVDVSPDGYWMAFDYWYFDVLDDIYIMYFPGANLTQLTDHPGWDFGPVWAPQP